MSPFPPAGDEPRPAGSGHPGGAELRPHYAYPPDTWAPSPEPSALDGLPPPPNGAAPPGPTASDAMAGFPTAPMGERVRPWWGMGDLLLALPFILLLAVLGTVAAIPFLSAADRNDLVDGVATPGAVAGMGLIGQQLGQGLWPVIVARWKGFGVVRDFGLRFKWIDLPIGLGTAFVTLIVAGVLSFTVSQLIGLDNSSEASNTQLLNDYEGSAWLWVIIAGAVVGAPFTEELLFRGLIQQAIQKRFGVIWAIAGSTFIFVLPHFTGSTLQGTLVLFTTIGVVGAILGSLVAYFKRLGPAIVTHVLFNLVGTLAALTTDTGSSEAFVSLVPLAWIG